MRIRGPIGILGAAYGLYQIGESFLGLGDEGGLLLRAATIRPICITETAFRDGKVRPVEEER